MNGRPKRSVSPAETRRLISDTAADWKRAQRKIDASPKREDFEREFGKDRVKDEADGAWSLTLKERHEIRRAHEMQEGARREEIEIGAHAQAKLKREKVTRRDGRVIDFPEELVDQAKHRFKGSPGRNGGAPSQRFSLSQAFSRYEQGPEGLWFVWNGGWEPISMWRNGALSPQTDPDGNIWVESGGEWILADEVAKDGTGDRHPDFS